MFNFIQLILAFSIIFIIAPQTPTENIVLRKIVESGLFPNYGKAKTFLIQLTWFLIFAFLLLFFLPM
jgi:hypothetical protein